MPFPLIKLGSLVLKQLSKPLANWIKRRAKNQGFFRDYVCIPFAQKYHKWDVKIRGRLAGIGKTKEVQPLNPELAVELGADLLGEAIIFLVASGTIYMEYARAARKDQNKENKQNSDIDSMKREMEHLNLVIEIQNAKIRGLQRHIGFVDKEVDIPKFSRELEKPEVSWSYVGAIYNGVKSIKESIGGKRTED